ncbi:MAG: porphobilinogen synthase [Candidatus Sumerlaeia bacterium]
MAFPANRMRRLRRTKTLRSMVRETHLRVEDLIYPLFVREGKGIRNEIASMPGQYQLSIDELLKECEGACKLGIPAIILFGIPDKKDPEGEGAYDENGITQRAFRAVKKEFPDLVCIADVCLCEYTSHGHCGVLTADQEVHNDVTLRLLAKTAVSLAEAEADIIAPSDMMDGRVGAIREALDEARFEHIPIMSYAAKFASSYYGPFRDAAESAPKFGDRTAYQMDPANTREAMREIELDIEEGADMIMVKPALAYLDIIAEARARYDLPLAAYNVSGEYAMIKAAAEKGWIDEERVMMESLLAMKRAGAEMILTYFAPAAAKLLRKE